MELTRKQVIEELQKMLDYCSIRQDSTPERKQAIIYAISSLKTDEVYQIMYEGGEIFTKADCIQIIQERMDVLRRMGLTKEDVCKGLYGIERVLEELEREDSPKQFEIHKDCLEYAINVLRGEQNGTVNNTD